MGPQTVDIEHVYEFVVFRWVFEVLHADSSFFAIYFHDHRFNEASENFEIFVFATKDTFCKFDAWCIYRILILVNTYSLETNQIYAQRFLLSRAIQ